MSVARTVYRPVVCMVVATAFVAASTGAHADEPAESFATTFTTATFSGIYNSALWANNEADTCYTTGADRAGATECELFYRTMSGMASYRCAGNDWGTTAYWRPTTWSPTLNAEMFWASPGVLEGRFGGFPNDPRRYSIRIEIHGLCKNGPVQLLIDSTTVQADATTKKYPFSGEIHTVPV